MPGGDAAVSTHVDIGSQELLTVVVHRDFGHHDVVGIGRRQHVDHEFDLLECVTYGIEGDGVIGSCRGIGRVFLGCRKGIVPCQTRGFHEVVEEVELIPDAPGHRDFLVGDIHHGSGGFTLEGFGAQGEVAMIANGPEGFYQRIPSALGEPQGQPFRVGNVDASNPGPGSQGHRPFLR